GAVLRAVGELLFDPLPGPAQGALHEGGMFEPPRGVRPQLRAHDGVEVLADGAEEVIPGVGLARQGAPEQGLELVRIELRHAWSPSPLALGRRREDFCYRNPESRVLDPPVRRKDPYNDGCSGTCFSEPRALASGERGPLANARGSEKPTAGPWAQGS